MQFKDTKFKKLDAKGLITDKLQQIDEFEANFRPNTASRAMYKWCTDYEYRKREWEWRQSIAEYALHNGHKAFQTSDKSTF
tara:strand:+ start:1843 stop:2085 length:243 start_codon:yes stop_codon:yes gene_type:complete